MVTAVEVALFQVQAPDPKLAAAAKHASSLPTTPGAVQFDTGTGSPVACLPLQLMAEYCLTTRANGMSPEGPHCIDVEWSAPGCEQQHTPAEAVATEAARTAKLSFIFGGGGLGFCCTAAADDERERGRGRWGE
eukprot:INCI5726.1.p1 GENE.INCI5726.1~~INCI5726.1.p1  ORF type:complete len:134 (+),score=23.29 INCI5726.1:341-742(+)